jgi:hypothetical protein
VQRQRFNLIRLLPVVETTKSLVSQLGGQHNALLFFSGVKG